MALFTDLNIVFPSEKKKLQNVIETAAHRNTVIPNWPQKVIVTFLKWHEFFFIHLVGYSSVAINHVADFQEKKREIGKPTSPETLFSTLPIVQGTSKPIRVLNRLTLVVSDHSHCNELRATSPRTRLYDVVAVFPKTEKLFHAACTSLDVDLICINVTEKQPFPVRRPAVNAAIERGIYFELVYTPAIKDSTMRRYTISNVVNLMQTCKGKNIIISSAAENVSYKVNSSL
uniref:Ribonuclease P protein subunit p30 n=1 Tax=Latimeria chalumnae TaxID=7897 RepID=H2ZZL5_LATCH